MTYKWLDKEIILLWTVKPPAETIYYLWYTPTSPSPARGDLGGIKDVLLSERSALISSRAVLLCGSGIVTRIWSFLLNIWNLRQSKWNGDTKTQWSLPYILREGGEVLVGGGWRSVLVVWRPVLLRGDTATHRGILNNSEQKIWWLPWLPLELQHYCCLVPP